MSTKIEWTDESWNPVTGCTKVSAGCKNCYAERVFPRVYAGDSILEREISHGGLDGKPLQAGDVVRKRRFTDVRCHPERLDQPLRWRKPRRVFVCSMGDLFHEDVPDEFIAKIFNTMAFAPNHIFQILTKRPERMRCLIYEEGRHWSWYDHEEWGWPLFNIWLGVSCEDQAAADERIPLLLQTPAAVRFVSCEPLLGAVDLFHVIHPDGWYSQPEAASPTLDWVIAGCESGPKARPAETDWFRSLRDQCQEADVPFFLKQMMVNGKKVSMPKLDGKVWAEYPK